MQRFKSLRNRARKAIGEKCLGDQTQRRSNLAIPAVLVGRKVSVTGSLSL
jgi:hypothetical protein